MAALLSALTCREMLSHRESCSRMRHRNVSQQEFAQPPSLEATIDSKSGDGSRSNDADKCCSPHDTVDCRQYVRLSRTSTLLAGAVNTSAPYDRKYSQ